MNSLYQNPPIFLDKIKTIHYENRILIVIDESLTKLVGDKIEFQSAIQNGKFVLIGPELLESMKDQSQPNEVVTTVKAV